MPSSMALLDLRPAGMAAGLQLPMGELQVAFGHEVARHPNTLMARSTPTGGLTWPSTCAPSE